LSPTRNVTNDYSRRRNPTYLGEDVSNFEHLQLLTTLLVLLLVDTVGDNNLVNGTSIDAINGITTQHAVGDESDDLVGTLLLQELGCASDGVGGVGKIVDKDSDTVCDVTYQHHCRILAVGDLSRATLLRYGQNPILGFSTITSPYLVDERKGHTQSIGDGSCTFGTASIRTDDDGVLILRDVELDVLAQEVLAVQVVNRDVEEALILRVVEVHCDDVIGASAGKKVGNQCTSLRDPLLVTPLRFKVWRSLVESGYRLVAVGAPIGHGGCERIVFKVFGFLRCHRLHGRATRHLDGTAAALTIAVGMQLHVHQLLVQVLGASLHSGAFCLAGHGRCGSAVKGVVAIAVQLSRSLGERSASLVVGNVALSRVREEREDGGDALGRGSLAGRDGDEKLHQVVVDLAAAGLDDEDVLASDRVHDLDASLSNSELAEKDVCRRDTEVIADCLGQLGMRAASQNDQIAYHVDDGCVCRKNVGVVFVPVLLTNFQTPVTFLFSGPEILRSCCGESYASTDGLSLSRRAGKVSRVNWTCRGRRQGMSEEGKKSASVMVGCRDRVRANLGLKDF